MSLDNLKESIKESTGKEIKNIKEEADAKIEEINKKTDEEIKLINEETKRSIEAESKRLIDEYTSNADLMARNIIDEAKQKAIDEEYNTIKSKLINELTKNEKYIKIIKSAIDEATKKLGEDGFSLLLDKEYKKSIEVKYPKIKIKEGKNKEALIKSNDNKIIINIAPDIIIETYSTEIKKRIYESLFKNRKSKFINTKKNKKVK
ncbi:MAG: hypothetical protein ACP5RQ_00745 [Candidatus Micrarchaeia archaeon]